MKKKKINKTIKKKHNESFSKKKEILTKRKILYYFDYIKNFNILKLLIKHSLKKIFIKSPIKMGLIKSYFNIEYRLILENNSQLKIRTLNFPKINFDAQPDYALRKDLSSCIESKDKFDLFFKKSIKFFFPKILLENFKDTKTNTIKFYKFNNKLKYIMNESFISDDYSAFNLAIGKEFFNVKHICNEHNYLNYFLFGNRIKEFSTLVDSYYSIGWKNNHFPLVKKGANLSILRINKEFKKTINILFLSSISYSRKPTFVNFISKEGGMHYYNQSDVFLKNLDKSIQKEIVIKIHPDSSKTLGFNYFYKKIKKFNIINSNSSSQEIMLQSKIIILDHYSTSFIEVLKLKIPFILILDKKYTYKNNLKNYCLDNLIKNKVIHDCPLKASKFLNKNYNNYLKWWNSKKVSNAIKNFTDKNIGDEVKFINKLVKLAK